MEERSVKQTRSPRRIIAYGFIGLFLLAYVYSNAIGLEVCIPNRCISFSYGLKWFWLFTLVLGGTGIIFAVISIASLIDMLIKLPENKKRAIWTRMNSLISLIKSRSLHLVLATAVYAVAMFMGTWWAIFIHTPCKSNFEGGCGYASLFAGVLSFLAAGTAIGMSAAMLAIALSFEDKKIRRWITICVGTLMTPPVLYIGYGIGVIFHKF